MKEIRRWMLGAGFSAGLLGLGLVSGSVVHGQSDADQVASGTPGKQVQVITDGGLVAVADNTLHFQPHSGMSKVVVQTRTRVFAVAMHAEPVSNGTPCTVHEVDRKTGAVLGQHFLGYADPASPAEGAPNKPNNHHCPQVVIDGEGHVVVLLGAHDGRMQAYRSVEPGTINAGFEGPNLVGHPAKREHWGYTYPAIEMEGNTMHVVCRWTGTDYGFQLVYFQYDTVTKRTSQQVEVARPSADIPWGQGRKHEWYHDLILIDGTLVVTGCPVSGPTGLGTEDKVRVHYPPLRKVSRDGGETWEDG